MKYLAMGIFGFAVAIGTALAGLSTSREAWVRVKFLGTDVFTCVNTGLDCIENGAVTCKVDILTISGVLTVNGKRQAACTNTLSNSSNSSVGSFSPLYGIIQSVE